MTVIDALKLDLREALIDQIVCAILDVPNPVSKVKAGEMAERIVDRVLMPILVIPERFDAKP